MTMVPKKRLPDWIRVRVGAGNASEVGEMLRELRLNTVCSGARCPNLGECFNRGTATFLIMGRDCTRDCKFCAIGHEAHPPLPEADEAERLAEASARLKLAYVVVTSVTRDDLPDGGASCFAEAIRAIRRRLPEAGIEVLTPDFKGDREALYQVLEAKPSVFNHNIETVERLSADIRSMATYRRSLEVLRMAAESGFGVPVKSGLMVGLGESDEEVYRTLRDLRESGVSILTIGQYLAPTANHWPVDRYVEPERFAEYGEYAKEIGFTAVASAPLVRSSYLAHELANKK